MANEILDFGGNNFGRKLLEKYLRHILDNKKPQTSERRMARCSGPGHPGHRVGLPAVLADEGLVGALLGVLLGPEEQHVLDEVGPGAGGGRPRTLLLMTFDAGVLKMD